MQIAKPAGQGASVVKYDILTALLAMAAQDAGTAGRLALRLALLITARFNWRSGTFQVGQREIAQLWGVTERTAKRELAQMRAMGWIAVQRPAARGRVATHSIDLDRIIVDSMPRWQSVGPDYAARMTGRDLSPPEAGGNVVPLHRAPMEPAASESPWSHAQAILAGQDAALYQAWFARLDFVALEDGTLTLAAPTAFVARYVETHFARVILAALARVVPGTRALAVTG